MWTQSVLGRLEEVLELNRAFLGYARSCARAGLDRLNLSPAMQRALSAATNEQLDAAATLPHALFRVRVHETPTGAVSDTLDADGRSLCQSILFEVRHVSRESPYLARFLFGLEAAEIARLRETTFAELQRLALTPGVVSVSFRERDWVLRMLLTTTTAEVHELLALVALQPRIRGEWPIRRAPHHARAR